MRNFSKPYVADDGRKYIDILIWDALEPVTAIQKYDRTYLIFKASVRDGIRYVNITEAMWDKNGSYLKYKPGGGISIPLRVPINSGTEIIEPIKELMSAVEQTIAAHENVPLEDPETRVVIKKEVKTKNGENQLWKKYENLNLE
jgi:hypothetical protein